MIAETVFNVFQALSLEEKKRFFKMCGVSSDISARKPKRNPVITKEESMEYLLRKFKR